VIKALVTGGAGFLGRHFATALRAAGYDLVVTPDIKKSGRAQDCRWHFARTDINYDLVIHCAAVVGGRSAIDGRSLDLSINLELDAAYARWLVAARPTAAVYVSSSAIYPVALQTDGVPRRMSEHIVNVHGTLGVPDQVYGWTKLVGEALMAKVQEVGVPVTIVRPFSGYGWDQDLNYPFPAFLRRALDRADPFDVWGPGTDVRDWIHVSDVVAATLRAVELGITEPVNLCTGQATTFDELARLVCTEAGYEPTLRHHEDAPRGVSYRVGHPARMRTFYEPQVALEQGVREAYQLARRNDDKETTDADR
jgi:nucleoside-diphosphate-sugar epimerase